MEGNKNTICACNIFIISCILYNYLLDNVFVETFLYVQVYLWIGQYLYCECMIYICGFDLYYCQ
jgi:hypothetical protein